MATHLLQNMSNGHIKVKKGTGHVFYMSTPHRTTESVQEPPVEDRERLTKLKVDKKVYRD